MEQKKFLKLNDIEAYKIAFHLSNYVWHIVIKWKHFERSTVGEQLVEAVVFRQILQRDLEDLIRKTR
jgi:hypothetical protein